jgi:RNA polymerase sigma factor (sigma-70 family)
MKDRSVHEDQKYIEGLLQNNSFIIQTIYDKFVPKVVNYIKNNNGDADQAQDVIQEVIVSIYNQAKIKKLQLSCPFDAYFFLLCKRKWLNELKKSSKKEVTINEEVLSKDDDASQHAFETEIFNEKQQLFNEMFQKLGDACKELLKTTFQITSMEEVAEKLGVTYAYVRKKKSLCIGQLTSMVQESSAYKKIQNLL